MVNADRLLDEPSYFVEQYCDVSNDKSDVPNEVFDYQKDFMDTDSSRKLFVSGRRVGKSRTAAWLALWKAATHAETEVLITAKAQRQSMELFNQIKTEVRQSPARESEWGIVNSTRTEMHFDNGARIVCLPVGRDGSNIRGYGADLIIVDEAAFIKDEIFQQVLSPMLAVGDGTFVLLSTPFGKKGFLYERYNDPDWYKVQVPTSANPLIDDKFIEEQRQTQTRTQFRQELLGQFVESADSYFTRDELMACAKSDPVDRTGDLAFLGVDLASQGADESVYVSIDSKGNIFDIETKADGRLTDAMGRIRELDSYNSYDRIVIDSTGLGEGVVDQVKEDLGRKVEGFKFTNEKKQSLYNTLKNALQDGELSYHFVPGKNELDGNKLVNQCLDLEYDYTSTGKLRIEHPSGGHDDYSDAFALAVWAKSQKNFARSDGSMKPFTLGSLRT